MGFLPNQDFPSTILRGSSNNDKHENNGEKLTTLTTTIRKRFLQPTKVQSHMTLQQVIPWMEPAYSRTRKKPS